MHTREGGVVDAPPHDRSGGDIETVDGDRDRSTPSRAMARDAGDAG